MKFKESKSIYLQIADRICDEILQGQYKEEERIPSVREYAATVEVNANTVVRSFDYLQGQDIIYNKRGLGYFVLQGGLNASSNSEKKSSYAMNFPSSSAS
jgi:DNA-binding transcriptional regulator YhcF (GntR family)